jgi:ligand-binding SRPBCC domain-containing protein
VTSISIDTLIDAPPDVCFDLARDVVVHAESAAFSGERLVEPGRGSGLLEVGDLVTFEGRHFGIRQHFTAKITRIERPHLFIDEMVRGAFRSLRHIHEFHAVGEGTLMRDTLEWRAPFGWLADPLFLRRHMEWFVRTKQQNLKRIIEERIGSGLRFSLWPTRCREKGEPKT